MRTNDRSTSILTLQTKINISFISYWYNFLWLVLKFGQWNESKNRSICAFCRVKVKWRSQAGICVSTFFFKETSSWAQSKWNLRSLSLFITPHHSMTMQLVLPTGCQGFSTFLRVIRMQMCWTPDDQQIGTTAQSLHIQKYRPQAWISCMAIRKVCPFTRNRARQERQTLHLGGSRVKH